MDTSTFTAPKITEEKERRLALKLWTLLFEWNDAERPVDRKEARARLQGALDVASDVLGYGMTPFAAEMAVAQAIDLHDAVWGAKPAQTSSSIVDWRETLTDRVVEALRGLR